MYGYVGMEGGEHHDAMDSDAERVKKTIVRVMFIVSRHGRAAADITNMLIFDLFKGFTG